MDEVGKQQALSAIRTILGVLGGYLVSRGILKDSGTLDAVIGALMILLPLAWGMWDKHLSEQKTQAREVVALNAGIVVADTNVGKTPTVAPADVPSLIAMYGVPTGDKP